MQNCPCGSEKLFQACCGAFIAGTRQPSTPEELMRSRYTAYTLADTDYITRTMKSPAADNYDSKAASKWARSVSWQKLKVISSVTVGAKGFVEFIAYFTQNNQPQTIHELSEFHLIEGLWYYVDGCLPKPRSKRRK